MIKLLTDLSLRHVTRFNVPSDFQLRPMGNVILAFREPRRVGEFLVGFLSAEEVRSDSQLFHQLAASRRLADAQVANFLFHTPGVLPRELEQGEILLKFPGSIIPDEDRLPNWINLFWAGKRWSFDLLPPDFPPSGLVAVMENPLPLAPN